MNSVTEIVWKDIEKVEKLEILTEQVMQKCFEVECINPTSFYICVTLTNPQNIRKMNKKYRNIDKPTDVLSFPMFEKQDLNKLITKNLLKQNQNLLKQGILQDILGDIIISIPKVEEQAKEYGHSFEREFAYMLVHGFYHIRGYDHMTEEEKVQMRAKEENVLGMLAITR